MATRTGMLINGSDGARDDESRVVRAPQVGRGRSAGAPDATWADDLPEREAEPGRAAAAMPPPAIASGVAPTNVAPRGPGLGSAFEPPRPLTAMAAGVVAAAAIFVGLAMVVFAFAFGMSLLAQFLVAMLGAWFTAAGIAFVVAMAPRQPSSRSA